MSKKKNVLSQEEIKKKQNKIIWITRIIGLVLFLIGISIIFVTAFIRSRYVDDLGNDSFVMYESVGDNFYLYQSFIRFAFSSR